MRTVAFVLAALVAASGHAAPPEVVGAPYIVSAPASGGSYAVGEAIRVRLAFSEDVRLVDRQRGEHVSAGLWFALADSGDREVRRQDDGSARVIGWNSYQAAHEVGAFSHTLTFIYTVKAGDLDEDGVSVPANALFLLNAYDGRGLFIENRAGETANPATTCAVDTVGYCVEHEAMPDQPGHKINCPLPCGQASEVASPDGCTPQVSPYSAMTDSHFTETWNPVSYEPYRFVTALEHDVAGGGIYKRTMQIGRLTAHLKVHDGKDEETAGKVMRLVAQTFANVPGLLTQALDELTVDFVPENMIGSSPARTLYPSIIWISDRLIRTDWTGRVFVASHSHHPNFEELLVHELAHLLDYKLGFPSSSPEWETAVQAVPCRVTRYAHENGVEHFAEALSAYLQFYAGRDTLGRHREVLKARLGKAKMRYFARLLSPSHDYR